ncbi:macrolide ABC transporter ATP-binding protein [Syntrophotalea acetylenivorans]|uniref:Macrolide ABC transporter ATP-binding protein n=1 Tax=Syntrophotalea acetylenivorans TaxID=1842532 RepID=A0A1L3GRK2_9BACT|nr:ABC transporter ATP-binding protein [Syntrophotalea acetylenivorans]APG28288.1 macrolide ABC transporter ATP-binding protein [Syntrophotalea acetylenivorans]
MSGSEPIIRLEQIDKTYLQGDLTIEVLKNIDLSVSPGEFIALQGASGSGKSTLMHILGLLDRPSSGRYLFQGQNVAELADDRLSELRNRQFGFIFQSFYLVPYVTALENVILPGLYSATPAGQLRQRAQKLLEQVGLADRMHFRPSQLSGGQQQRVAMARALMNDPPLLLADEPTGQLDSSTSAGIMELLREMHDQGRTVILVTHEAEVSAAAERIIVLHDGRIEPS